MISDPIERLRAANPEPWCPPPPIDEIWRRIEARDGMRQDSVRAQTGGPAKVRARVRSTAGVVAALSSVTVVLAVGAIALLAHGRGTTAGSSSGAQQLVSTLAVLRRAQTRADMLPRRLHIASPLTPRGRIIPQFTRLVRTLPNARFYLVVTTWSPDSIWSPQLSDQVSIVEISGGHATETVPIPAADLTNANEVSEVSPGGLGAQPQRGAYWVGIVPDGVAHARWTFAKNLLTEPGPVVDATVASNVAITAARPDASPVPLRAAWYAPNGQRVATSNQALLAAQAARQAGQKAQLIRTVREHPYHADPSLLAAFAVFAITSRAGVKTAAGDLISHPPLTALPLDILQSYSAMPGKGPQFDLDFTQVRKVITPSGASLYVIPGQRALCVATGDRSSPFPDAALSGGGGGSCNLLPGVESRGVSFTSGFLGIQRTFEIVPKTVHTITVRNSRGIRTTIPVPDGIYVSPRQRTQLLCRSPGMSRLSVLHKCPPRAR